MHTYITHLYIEVCLCPKICDSLIYTILSNMVNGLHAATVYICLPSIVIVIVYI